MKSGVPWHVKGVGEEARETAQEAARRAGMSVGEWLDTVITGSARNDERQAAPARLRAEVGEEADAKATEPDDPPPRVLDARAGQPGAGRLNDVNSRLDSLNRQLERLARTQAAPAARTPDTDIRTSERPRPPSSEPATPLDQALVEIAARQRALDGEAPVHVELPRAPTQDFSTLEAQLRQLNSRIDGLRPCGIDSAVETLRDDLAEIGLMMKEAMPRRAVEALENEVRSLAARIDSERHAGVDAAALSGLERGLAEVRDALLALKPAESLVELDQSMRGLTQRIEKIAGGPSDPAMLEQFESAIVGLRGIVSHVASNEALANLSDEVRSLAAKVDQITGADVISTLEQRIGTIADALQARHQQNGQDVRDLEGVVERLTGKLEQMHLSRADHAAVIHLEDRIAKLVEKLDSSDARLVNLEAIERGLAELLIHIEHQRVPNLTRGDEPAAADDTLKRDVQRTQDSLEAVHGTLGHLVDRLAMIETSIRNEAQFTAAPVPTNDPEPPPEGPPRPPGRTPAVPPRGAASAVAVTETAAAPLPNPAPATERDRRPIDPDLPPDTPLEPGATRGRTGSGSAAERIAASETALGPVKPPVIPDPGGKTNFIAAARRAAQAANNEVATRPDKRIGVGTITAGDTAAGRWNKLVRQLLAATSVLAIVLGSLQIAANLFSPTDVPERASSQSDAAGVTSSNGVTQAPAPTATPDNAQPSTAPALPPAPAQTPAGREPLFLQGGNTIPFAPPSGVVIPPARPTGKAQQAEMERSSTQADPVVTGSVAQPHATHAATAQTLPPLPPHSPGRSHEKPLAADKLPATIGSGGLRAAAVKGDAGAEYEIALRYAEGRGVPKNPTAAAEWFERAAKQGLVMAEFRLGGHYEKGLGVRKDIEAARRLYTTAAEAGNAKAMHNLAVLYADGTTGKPDYQTAARWFHKAADYGVADSQYNLGILYARGIGVEANLPEAYKWFTLAARDGDKEAAKKRDDVATRLNPRSLTAARAAVQGWSPAAQPAIALDVKAPAGGWDNMPTPSVAKRHIGPKATATAAPAQ